MAVDVFLKIGDIKGESLDSKHKDEIDVESFSFGQAADASESGQRSGRIDLQDFSFVIPMSKASPSLMKICATGEHVSKGLYPTADAQVTVRSVGQTAAEFLTIKFYDVMISSYQTGAAAAQATSKPMEQFAMWFAKVELEYKPQSPTGQLGPSVYFKWDRIKGEAY